MKEKERKEKTQLKSKIRTIFSRTKWATFGSQTSQNKKTFKNKYLAPRFFRSVFET